MDNLKKVGKVEAIGLMVMIMINQIILNLGNVLILATGSSAWINIIYISILAVLFTLLICKLFQPFENADILDVSEFLGGKFLKIIIGIVYILFFLFLSALLLRYLTSSLKLIYFNNSPLVFLLLFFIVPSVIVVKMGIKAIAKVNLVFMPILLISMLVILFSTSKYFVPQRIFPIFGFGLNKTLLSGTINICSFISIGYLYFLIPILKDPKQFKKIAVSSIIFSAIYLFLSVICLLMMFPFISFTDEMLSIYLLTRMIEFGRFLQRIDAIFILIWILSMLSFISISSFLISDIFKKLTKIKDSKYIVYCIGGLLFSIALSIKNIAIIKYLENIVLKYIILVVVFIISLIILVLGYFKKKRKVLNEN